MQSEKFLNFNGIIKKYLVI